MSRSNRFHHHALTLAVIAGLGLAHAGPTLAANAVIPLGFDQGTTSLNPGGSLTLTTAGGSINSYTNNPALAFSAWAHTGRWWNFELTSATDVTLSVTATNAVGFSPGVSVWASGSTPFDGGTVDLSEFSLLTGFNTPHQFNAVGDIGDAGTGWMSGSNGNMVETLAYAVSNPSIDYDSSVTGWGETIQAGAHDVSNTDLFESGITGSTSAGFAELVFSGLQTGWYTVYVGGTDSTSTGDKSYTLAINAAPTPTAVPLPGAALLFGSGVLGLVGGRRPRRA